MGFPGMEKSTAAEHPTDTQLIHLDHEGVGAREIRRRLGLARSTIQDNLQGVRAASLTWPLPPDMTDELLAQKLFRGPGVKPGLSLQVGPEWASVARELKRPSVNLTVLWEEYRQHCPHGYSYS